MWPMPILTLFITAAPIPPATLRGADILPNRICEIKWKNLLINLKLDRMNETMDEKVYLPFSRRLIKQSYLALANSLPAICCLNPFYPLIFNSRNFLIEFE